MCYKIYRSVTFLRKFSTLSTNEQAWVEKREEKLAQSGAGTVLNPPWLFEKKSRSLTRRLYFARLMNEKKILILGISNKKNQEETINLFKNDKEFILNILRNLT